MYVKTVLDVFSGSSIQIYHDGTSLYTGAPANVPFYLLNERVTKIEAVTGPVVRITC